MRILDLRKNQLTKLSDNIHQLECLEVLYLGNNCLRSLPSNIIQCSNLRGLDLNENYLDLSVLSKNKELSFFLMATCRNYNQQRTPSMIDTGVYLSSVHAAYDKEELERLGITHILSVGAFTPHHPGSFVYKVIDIMDWPSENLKQYFPEIVEFINEGIKEGGILVHCLAGKSRSSSAIMAWIIATKKQTFDEAYRMVLSRRPVIWPNLGFQQQLKEWEQEILSITHLSNNSKREQIKDSTNDNKMNELLKKKYCEEKIASH